MKYLLVLGLETELDESVLDHLAISNTAVCDEEDIFVGVTEEV